jgi:hypothetical protein
MMLENATERTTDENGKQFKYSLYDGPICVDELGMIRGGVTMDELRERYDPRDPLDRLDKVIFMVMLVGVAFGMLLILQSV